MKMNLSDTTKMKTRCLVIIILISASSWGLAQQADLLKWKTQYDQAILVVETEAAKSQSVLLSGYMNDIQTLRSKFQIAGDLDKLKLILAEITRVQTEKTLPATLLDVSEAKTFVAAYQQRSQEEKTRRAQRIVALVSQYDKALGTLQVKLTQEGKLPAASAVQDERKRLFSSEPLMAAKALLGSASEIQPSSRTLQPQETKPTASPAFGEVVLSGTQKEGDVTIRKGQKCVVKGDYVVPNGKTLNIQEGAELTFERNASLSVSGVINAIGTLDKPIMFKGRGNLSSFWVGVSIISSDKSVVSYAYISEAASGIKTTTCKPMIDNCVFRNNEVGVTAGASSSPNIEHCLIEKNKGNGITIEWSASAIVRKSTISENRGKGVWGGLYCGFDIAETIIEKNKSGGVESVHGKVTAKDSVISDNGEFDVFNNGPYEWDFSGNYFGPNITAILRSKGDTAKIAAIKGTVRLNNFLSAPPVSCGYKPQVRK